MNSLNNKKKLSCTMQIEMDPLIAEEIGSETFTAKFGVAIYSAKDKAVTVGAKEAAAYEFKMP